MSSQRRVPVRRLLGTAVALTALVAPATANATCRTFKHRAKIESSVFKTDLAYLNLSIRVCFNGNRITKAGTLDITPSFTKNAMGTWEWDGMGGDPIHEYRAWHGRAHGSYYVKASGQFDQSAAGVQGAHAFIWASMRIYGNGHVDKNRKNA
jgi:hypothetical protein